MAVEKLGINRWTEAIESLNRLKQAIPDPPKVRIEEENLNVKVTFSEAARRAAEDGFHRKEQTLTDLVPRFLRVHKS